MSFLGRIAARASTHSLAGSSGRTPAAIGESTPAMASTSPLVQFDQRLTLPRFSEFGLVPAPDTSMGELDAADGLSEPARDSTTLATGGPFGSVPASAQLLAQAQTRDLLPSPMAEAPSSGARTVGERAVLPNPAIAQSLDSLGVASQAPATTDAFYVSSQIHVPGPSDGGARRAVVHDVPSGGPRAADGEAPAELTPPGGVLDTIARLNAWLKTEGREIETKVLEETGTRPAALVLPAPNVTPGLPEAGSDDGQNVGSAGAPMISIGRLEIEVVPPPPRERRAPAPAASQRRQASALRTATASAPVERRSFGWRQR